MIIQWQKSGSNNNNFYLNGSYGILISQGAIAQITPIVINMRYIFTGLDIFAKQPSSVFYIVLDMTKKIGAASLSSSVITASLNGVDSTANVIATTSVSGKKANIQVKGGLHGENHKITIQTLADDGSTDETDIFMYVRNY